MGAKRDPMQQVGAFSGELKFAGGYFPQQLADQLSLVCLHRRTTRNTLIQEAVEEFLKNDPTTQTEMISEIATRVLSEFEEKQARPGVRKTSLTKYIDIVQRALERKKIPKTFASAIVQEMRQQYNDSL